MDKKRLNKIRGAVRMAHNILTVAYQTEAPQARVDCDYALSVLIGAVEALKDITEQTTDHVSHE